MGHARSTEIVRYLSTEYMQFSVKCSIVTTEYTLCLKKRPTFRTCYNFYIHSSIATIFGINVAQKVGNQNVLYFPTTLTSTSALPGETGNPEIASFHLNDACFSPTNTKQLRISRGQS